MKSRYRLSGRKLLVLFALLLALPVLIISASVILYWVMTSTLACAVSPIATVVPGIGWLVTATAAFVCSLGMIAIPVLLAGIAGTYVLLKKEFSKR